MKRLRLLIVPVALLLIVGTVRADSLDPQGVLDPTQAINILGFNLILEQGVAYDVTWSGCGLARLINPTAFASTSACIYFANLSGAPITTLDFTFNDTGIPGPFSCISADSFLSTCDASENGNQVTMDYSGGTPIPYTSWIPTIFIFGIVPAPGGPPITPSEANNDFSAVAQVPTYDPSTLVLVASGMGLLGLCTRGRRARASLAR